MPTIFEGGGGNTKKAYQEGYDKAAASTAGIFDIFGVNLFQNDNSKKFDLYNIEKTYSLPSKGSALVDGSALFKVGYWDLTDNRLQFEISNNDHVLLSYTDVAEYENGYLAPYVSIKSFNGGDAANYDPRVYLSNYWLWLPAKSDGSPLENMPYDSSKSSAQNKASIRGGLFDVEPGIFKIKIRLAPNQSGQIDYYRFLTGFQFIYIPNVTIPDQYRYKNS